MKLLVLTTRLFDEPGSGGEICTARLLQGLREAGHEVVLAGRGDARAAAAWAPQVHALGALEPAFDEQPAARRLRAVAAALLSRQPITVFRQGGRRLVEAVAPLLQACDAVIVDHLQAWPWLGAATDKPVMLVNHNVESDNYMRHSRAANRGCQGNPSTRPATRFLMRREAHSLRALELDVLEEAAVVACLSEADAERLQALAALAQRPTRARLLVLPGYPRTLPAAEAVARTPRACRRPRIGLIGTWTWAPNRQGLRWLLDQVWPHIGDRVELVLAGSGLQGQALPVGTRVLGRVADTQTFYDAVDLIAIPSLSGSGVQEKAIEAIGTGLPVVATTHALRGLHQALPAQVQAADEAADFAQACLQGLGRQDQAITEAQQAQAAARRWAQARRQDYAARLSEGLASLRPEASRGTGASFPCFAPAR